MARYAQLIPLIRAEKPVLIIEVGTHRGARAALMCREALRYNRYVHYIGYDLFDEATPEINVRENNWKGESDYKGVARLLDLIKSEHPNGFRWELVKGNTHQTLHGKSIDADFVFIDGGHSVETIRGDYEALKKSSVIVFDDYYTSGIDTSKFGCNEIVRDLNHEVLPIEDVAKNDVRVCMVVVKIDRDLRVKIEKAESLEFEE